MLSIVAPVLIYGVTHAHVPKALTSGGGGGL